MGVTPHLAEVITLYEENFRSIAPTLRKVADAIDNGDYGAVTTVGVVILGDTTEVVGMGPDSEACSVAMLLHAGFMRLSKAIEEWGK